MPVPNYLRRFREAHGIEAQDLAAQIGVSPSAVSKWESHQREVSDDYKKALAEFYNVPVRALFDFEYDATADALRRTIDALLSMRLRVELLEEQHGLKKVSA